MTRWRPWTPSRCWARPSGACSRWLTSGWRPSCGRCLPAATTTPAWPSRRSTGTTRRHERRWWMRAPGTRTRCSGCSGAARSPRRWPRPPGWLAAVVGQDLEQASDGSFRIARKVAADRVISVVDPDARHGHKTSARGFDGYKGHAWRPRQRAGHRNHRNRRECRRRGRRAGLLAELIDQVQATPPTPIAASAAGDGPPAPTPTLYGDSAYGTGPLLASLAAVGIDPRVKIQAAVAPKGHFTKDQFQLDPCRRHRHLSRAAHRPDHLQRRFGPPPPRPGQLR